MGSLCSCSGVRRRGTLVLEEIEVMERVAVRATVDDKVLIDLRTDIVIGESVSCSPPLTCYRVTANHCGLGHVRVINCQSGNATSLPGHDHPSSRVTCLFTTSRARSIIDNLNLIIIIKPRSSTGHSGLYSNSYGTAGSCIRQH